MSHIIHEIMQLEAEIDQQKLRLKEAIKNGVVVEEVKKIMLGIRELQKNFDFCLAKQ